MRTSKRLLTYTLSALALSLSQGALADNSTYAFETMPQATTTPHKKSTRATNKAATKAKPKAKSGGLDALAFSKIRGEAMEEIFQSQQVPLIREGVQKGVFAKIDEFDSGLSSKHLAQAYGKTCPKSAHRAQSYEIEACRNLHKIYLCSLVYPDLFLALGQESSPKAGNSRQVAASVLGQLNLSDDEAEPVRRCLRVSYAKRELLASLYSGDLSKGISSVRQEHIRNVIQDLFVEINTSFPPKTMGHQIGQTAGTN